MGGAASRINKEERVRICKERKRLMKQLVEFRGEFADAQLAYLRALKNTGVTLGQFTESESLELENTSTSYGLTLVPSSPPLPLPPSPPPPPPFSPDNGKGEEEESIKIAKEEEEEGGCTPPPPFIPSTSSWNFWDPFEPSSSSPHHHHHQDRSSKFVEPEPIVEEENWAETKSEFDQEDQEGEEVVVADGNVSVDANSVPQKKQQQQQQQQRRPVELGDDSSSMVSWCTKDTADIANVVRRSKKTLEGIVKELDDYFLKASAGGKEVSVLMDISRGDIYLPLSLKENKRRRSNSAKVFSALSWSWSSKSLQYVKDTAEVCSPSESCKPGAHCFTLDKLYAAEKKLYKEVKEEVMTKLELEKKSMLLLKQEEENHDWTKTEKTRSIVEGLDTDIRRLQHSISSTCSSILELIAMELHPQLVALTSGLQNMWRTMYECHQAQNHISQLISHLTDNQRTDFATDYHYHATIQLETEVTYWYNSFCKLIKCQHEYVRTLCKWIQLTNCLEDDRQQNSFSSAVRRFTEEWQLVFDGLPDKIASEAIKGLLSAIQSIMLQQAEEHNLHKRSDKLEKRLEQEVHSLSEMEKKLKCSFAGGDECSSLSPKHPLSLKRAKTEALKKRMDAEKTKYLNSVEVTRVMSLNNLKTSLPNVFRALMGFSSAYAQALEAVHRHGELAVHYDVSENSMGQI